MRRFLHFVFGLLLFVLILSAAGLAVYAAAMPWAWERALELLRGFRIEVMGAGSAMALLVILFALTGIRKAKKEDVISFETEGGVVSISIRAVRDFIVRLGDEFAAILSLEPRIRAPGSSIDIDLDVKVQAGTQIPELCKMLQERLRTMMKENLGLSDVRNVKVHVREIVARPPEKKAEEPTEWEGSMRV